MEVAVAVVTSVDNRMTQGDNDDIHSWVSEEDQKHFQHLRDTHEALVMGSNTYELMRDAMQHKADRLRVVLTSRPDEYADDTIPGQLEFYDKSPAQLVEYVRASGRKNLLIVGGGQMITDFIKAGLVNKIYLTIEPRLFGEGHAMITDIVDVKMHLNSSKQLNDKGTLLLEYAL